MSENMVSEKDLLVEASRSYLPEDLVWAVLSDLGVGTRQLPAAQVRETVLKHAESNGWPTHQVEEVLTRLGAQAATENPE